MTTERIGKSIKTNLYHVSWVTSLCHWLIKRKCYNSDNLILSSMEKLSITLRERENFIIKLKPTSYLSLLIERKCYKSDILILSSMENLSINYPKREENLLREEWNQKFAKIFRVFFNQFLYWLGQSSNLHERRRCNSTKRHDVQTIVTYPRYVPVEWCFALTRRCRCWHQDGSKNPGKRCNPALARSAKKIVGTKVGETRRGPPAITLMFVGVWFCVPCWTESSRRYYFSSDFF